MVQQRFKKYKTLRLKGYDYSTPGAYFVTICVKNRECFFGNVVKEQMKLNGAGIIAFDDIGDIPNHYEDINVGEFIVMPNHVHLVVYIYEMNSGRQASRLQDIVGSYKSGVSRKVRRLKEFENFRWQRYYFDHIVRGDNGLSNISDYIRINPLRWNEDIENLSFMESLTETERTKKAEKFYIDLIK